VCRDTVGKIQLPEQASSAVLAAIQYPKHLSTSHRYDKELTRDEDPFGVAAGS